MRRLCFDTENSYFKRSTAIASIEAHRALAREKHMWAPIRLKCAVVYDELEGRYYEFRPEQLGELIDCLSSAELLISHSGLRHDLPVLECLAGTERTAPIYELRHHDLLDELPWGSVEYHAKKHVPAYWKQYAAEYEVRCNRIGTEHASTKANSLTDEGWFLRDLAKATFDVKCTYQIYKATEHS